MKHLIIGGVAGGATAAARIRRADESAEIILLEKGKYISYANCGLPYYIGGVISDRDNLFVQTPEGIGKRFNIDVRVENEVTDIDTTTKTVTVKKTDGTTYTESYDKLLLSPGSNPVIPPLKGIESEGIFTLRNVEDTDRIKNYLNTHKVHDAVVVGGGFIGLEMAENLQHAGAKVSIVEMADQVMTPVDFSIASHVHRHLMDKGISLWLQTGVSHFEQVDGRLRVCFNDGGSIMADMVLLSVGVRANTELAIKAGIELGERGIKVDNYLQTSAPDVYAVGDAIEFTHPLTGKPWLNFLANPANRQGRIVADNMVFGNHTEYEGAIGTSIAKVFDLTVGATGLPAKRLQQLGIAFEQSTTSSAAHASYYPGAFQLTTKLTFDPQSGKLYGAQCVGHDGVDKRIDQVALLIKHGGTIYDLIKLEHTYAPPFSSAKDPLAIAGYTAANIINGSMPIIHWRELKDMDLSGTTLIDVRTADEYGLGTIRNAINIPVDELRERIHDIPADKPVIVFCAIGLRGYIALKILTGRGFKNVRNLSGGYKTYTLATQTITHEDSLRQAQGKLSSSQVNENDKQNNMNIITVDACGLQCPGPILKLKKNMDTMSAGERIEVKATDPGFPRDAEALNKIGMPDPRNFVVGIDLDSFPFAYKDANGAYWGFDIELATAACELLGWELSLQPIENENTYVELSSGNIDCAWGGIAIDQKMVDEGKYEPLGPYAENDIIIASRAGSGIASKLQLRGKRMAMNINDESLAALDTVPRIKNSLGQIIRLTGGSVECFQYLYDNKCDLVLTDSTAAIYYKNR